jgi:hypothetical protein
MDTVERRPRAEAVRSWAADAAAQDPGRSYAAGVGHGLVVGLALGKLDAPWASAALEELVRSQHDRLAAALDGTPVPAPTLESHRLMVFAQAQEVLRRSAADEPTG